MLWCSQAPTFSRIASVLAVALLLLGCATTTPIPREIGRIPTASEQKLIDVFALRVIAAARLEGFTCEAVRFAMIDLPHDGLRSAARPSTNPCDFYIQVNPKILRRDSPAELSGTFAHELAHVINRDWTPARAETRQIDQERQADAVAMRILKRLGAAACLAQVEYFRKIRAENIEAWGVEQRFTAKTHPSYTERIRTFEAGCVADSMDQSTSR